MCLVPFTKTASQYPGLYLFTTPARMTRPLLNIAAGKPEMIGTFEQVIIKYLLAADGIMLHSNRELTRFITMALGRQLLVECLRGGGVV